MGRKKKPEPDDPARSARFIETAERIQADDAEEKFEEAMNRILSKKPRELERKDHEAK